jgi:putative heme transporter
VDLPPVSANVARAAGWSWRVLVCAAALLAVLAVLWYFRVIVMPVMVALTVAPALAPVAATLRRRLGRSAAAVALLVGLVALAGLVAIVTASVVSQYDQLVGSLRQAAADLTDRLAAEPFDLSLTQTGDLQSSLSGSWREASGYLLTSVQAGAGLLGGTVLAVALLYFVLRDGAAFWEWVLARLTPDLRPPVDQAGRRAWTALGGFIRGTALIATIDAALIGVGLLLLGVPLAFGLAVLVFLGAFVPFLGAFVSGLVAVLVAFADGGWQIGLAALALVLAVQFAEGTFLQPIIQSRTVDLHPAVILLAVAAGASLFGILGAYLAVPVTAVVFAALGPRHPDPTAPDTPPDAAARPGEGRAAR